MLQKPFLQIFHFVVVFVVVVIVLCLLSVSTLIGAIVKWCRCSKKKRENNNEKNALGGRHLWVVLRNVKFEKRSERKKTVIACNSYYFAVQCAWRTCTDKNNTCKRLECDEGRKTAEVQPFLHVQCNTMKIEVFRIEKCYSQAGPATTTQSGIHTHFQQLYTRTIQSERGKFFNAICV